MKKHQTAKNTAPAAEQGEELHDLETDRAAKAIALAEAELKRAKEAYERVYDEAIRRLRDVREAKVGDLCDGLCDTVKRYPGPSLVVTAVLGFFLGRLFRR